MADIKTREERSRNMSAIKNKETKPEVFLRKLLFSHGYRYRKYSKHLPGHPDIWMKKYNTAIFVNGCFWHRHRECKYAYTPKSRTEFWEDKFRANTQRDKQLIEELEKKKIKCLIIWECSIKKAIKNHDSSALLHDIERFLISPDMFFEI